MITTSRDSLTLPSHELHPDTPVCDLSRPDIAAFARHLASEGYSAENLAAFIGDPHAYTPEYVRWLCGCNADFDSFWTLPEWLEYGVTWRECLATGIIVTSKPIVVDMTDHQDELEEWGTQFKFSVKAVDKQKCPDAFGTWTLAARVTVEMKYGRKIATIEVEAS